MRYTALLYSLLTASLASITIATGEQRPVMDNLGPAIPIPGDDAPPSNPNGDTVILTDVIGRDRSINIFAGFTRDISSVDDRLSDQSLNTTVLAPLNSAIVALSRKPWEDPEDYAELGPSAYDGDSGEERAHANLRRFVEAHIVPASPWAEGQKVETMLGDKIWWEMKDGKKMVSGLQYFGWSRC